MTFVGLGHFGLGGPLPHLKITLKIFDNFISVTTSILYAGSIIIYWLLLCSFFPSDFKRNLKTFVGPWKCCRLQVRRLLFLLDNSALPHEWNERTIRESQNLPVWYCHENNESWKDLWTSVLYLNSVSILWKLCNHFTDCTSHVKMSMLCLTRSLYLRRNRKINPPRYRQRATLHISCHHLQARDHKSTPLSAQPALHTVRTIHKTCPYALYYQPSWFTVYTVSKLNTNRSTQKYILLQPLSKNRVAQVMSAHSSFTPRDPGIILRNTSLQQCPMKLVSTEKGKQSLQI